MNVFIFVEIFSLGFVGGSMVVDSVIKLSGLYFKFGFS